jgi:hypothetical protein
VVGPRELQNFSLSGTVTRPAEQTAPQQAESASKPKSSAPSVAARAATAEKPIVRKVAERSAAASETPPPAEPQLQQVTASPPAVQLAAPQPAAAPAALAPPAETTTATLAPARGFPILPWLLAAVVLGAGGAFFLWRSRSRSAFAGGPNIDLFSAEPEPAAAPPAPAPRPAPVPTPPAAAPAPAPKEPVGIVSTALRPWIEVAMQPLRCIVTDDLVTIEFELDLFNSGSAPARDIHVAAAMIGAGEGQDQALASFFMQRPGPGDRIELIQPLKRVTFTTQIATARNQVQALEAGGRLVFVPVIAFNANYGWSGKNGQTSVSYLVGREGKTEKLAPFRLDLGPRLFRGLGARPLPTGVRR